MRNELSIHQIKQFFAWGEELHWRIGEHDISNLDRTDDLPNKHAVARDFHKAFRGKNFTYHPTNVNEIMVHMARKFGYVNCDEWEKNDEKIFAFTKATVAHHDWKSEHVLIPFQVMNEEDIKYAVNTIFKEIPLSEAQREAIAYRLEHPETVYYTDKDVQTKIVNHLYGIRFKDGRTLKQIKDSLGLSDNKQLYRVLKELVELQRSPIYGYKVFDKPSDDEVAEYASSPLKELANPPKRKKRAELYKYAPERKQIDHDPTIRHETICDIIRKYLEYISGKASVSELAKIVRSVLITVKDEFVRDALKALKSEGIVDFVVGAHSRHLYYLVQRTDRIE